MTEELLPGTRVEVRTGFDRSWATGFEVVGVADGRYRVRRLSDGSDVPVTFPPDDVRRARRSDTLWWI